MAAVFKDVITWELTGGKNMHVHTNFKKFFGWCDDKRC